jgi:hypothetical protein
MLLFAAHAVGHMYFCYFTFTSSQIDRLYDITDSNDNDTPVSSPPQDNPIERGEIEVAETLQENMQYYANIF